MHSTVSIFWSQVIRGKQQTRIFQRVRDYGVSSAVHVSAFPATGELSFGEDYADLLNDIESFRPWRDLSDHLLVMLASNNLVLDSVQWTIKQVETEIVNG